MSSDETVIELNGVSKRYEIYEAPRDRLKQMLFPRIRQYGHEISRQLGLARHPRQEKKYFREFWALRNISLSIMKGETFGIIGRNGSGKSTLLQLIAGTIAPTSGLVATRGRIAALLELGSGFNPEFTGRENVYLNSAILGMGRVETTRRIASIIEFADIGDFFDQPVKTYSSGMFVRLAFAVQAHVDASIVLIDEALAVGDVFFRQKCYERLHQLRSNGAAIVLVSHSMSDVEQFCERAILLDHGQVKYEGSAVEATKHYYLVDQEGRLSVSAGTKSEKDESHQGEVIASSSGWRPSTNSFLDISSMPQISNGWGRCVGVALCNAKGEGTTAFRQGEVAIFHYEFEVSRAIGAAIGGLVICNDKGTIVHGRNTWQFEETPSVVPTAGCTVLFTHEIVLDLAPGEYVFEVGLAAISEADWENRSRISHTEMSARHIRLCHVPKLGPFFISLADRDGVQILTHHGVANLPGSIRTRVVAATNS